MNYYLISEERLRDLLLLERKEIALLFDTEQQQPDDTADESAVKDHAAKIITEQNINEPPEWIIRSISEQLNDIADIGNAE